MGIVVSWIGWHIDLTMLDKVPCDGPSKPFMHDAYEYKFDRYGLTQHGQAVCVEDYCISLANQKSTHVFLF